MAGNHDAKFRQLKKFMEDACYTYTDEWLEACMEWVHENFPNDTNNVEVFKRELRDQWIDSNLLDLESSCLPPNLAGQRHTKLPKQYGLQVNSVQDIGESCYSQWTKLKKLENENASVAATDSNEYTQSWQPKQKRCLYLTMTDGTQTVFGLEMEPITAFSLNMKPGVKIVIIGPVDCRRGVFHLWKNNIRLVGGEVEDLVQSNTMENLLSEALRLTPAQRARAATSNSNPKITQPTNSNPKLTQPSNSKTIRNDNKITRYFPESAAVGQSADVNTFSAEDDALFMDIDEEALLSSASSTSTIPVIPSIECPYVFLKQVSENLEQLCSRRKVIHVKACISTIISSIKAEHGCWTICVCITDGTGYLNCTVSHNIITDIVGYTPNEMKRLKAAKSPGAKEAILKAMTEFSQRLVHLNSIFAIEMGEQPMIIEIIDMKLHHSIAMKNILSQVGL